MSTEATARPKIFHVCPTVCRKRKVGGQKAKDKESAPSEEGLASFLRLLPGNGSPSGREFPGLQSQAVLELEELGRCRQCSDTSMLLRAQLGLHVPNFTPHLENGPLCNLRQPLQMNMCQLPAHSHRCCRSDLVLQHAALALLGFPLHSPCP